MPRHFTRRQVLTATATVPFTGRLATRRTDARATDRTRGGPVRARGTRLRTYDFTPETVTYEEWYVSPDLRERYGSPRMRFDRLVFDRRHVAPALDDRVPDHGRRVEQSPLSELVGTEAEWTGYLRRATRPSGETTSDTGESGTVSTATTATYRGPRWVFKRSDVGTYAVAAPVNVVWDVTGPGSFWDVVNELRGWEWRDTGECAYDRYVFADTGDATYVERQTAQLATDLYCADARDHVRLWHDRHDTFGGRGKRFKIGAVHHDPLFHMCLFGRFAYDAPEHRLRDEWTRRTTASASSLDLRNRRDETGCRLANDRYAAFLDWEGPT